MGYGIQSVSSGGGGTTYTDKTLAQLEALSPVLYDMGKPTDSPYELRCESAGTWSYYLPGVSGAMTPPGTAFDSATAISEDASEKHTGGKRLCVRWAGSSGADQLRAYVVPAGATFTVVARVSGALTPPSFWLTGLVLRESATGKLVTFRSQSGIAYWSSSTSYGGSESPSQNTQMRWMKVVLDATNLTYSVSADGSTWTQVLQHAKGTRFTTQPNQVGVFGRCNPAATFASQMYLDSWSLT